MGNRITLNKSRLGQWLHYHLLEKKLNTGFGYLFLIGISILISYITATIDVKAGPAAVALVAVILLFVVVMNNPYFGFYFLIIYTSFIPLFGRLMTFTQPLGILLEVVTYVTFLSILLKYDLKKNIDLRFWSNPISMGMYILLAYYLIELFNPEMKSQLGWFSFFRKQISYYVFYYMCYCLLDSRQRIIYFIRFMIAFTSVLSLYAIKQQWFGYAGFELRSIGTGSGLSLLLQAGLLRKFSVFTDPATSGMLFASIFTLCIILFIRTSNKIEKFWLGLAGLINLLGYSYSGTRTATLMIAAGILLYCIATLYERRTIIFLMISVLSFIGLMVIPYENAVTNRIKSTFQGTKDASASVRDYNRHEVQPYIQEHPFGGGIFTCGFEGPKYNKGHYLENLQPDSGYLKTLAEQGAFGLALLLIFYFIIMRHGLHYFFRVRDPEIKNYYIGLLIMMFTLLVAQYAQMAITQYPVVFYFYATMVIFIKLADFDKTVQPLKPKTQI